MKNIYRICFLLSLFCVQASASDRPFGVVSTHEIADFKIDEGGNAITDIVVVPYEELPKPAFNEATQKADPVLVWSESKVTRNWVISSITAVDLKAKAPASVTKRQLREWLIRNDLFETVENAIGAIPDAKEKMIAWNWWETSQSYEITHPLILQLGASIGMTETQIYQAWIAASKL